MRMFQSYLGLALGAAVLACAALLGCGSSGSSGSGGAGGAGGGAPDAATPGGDASVRAAQQTATQNSECRSIAPFYWEIGDGTRLLASGSVDALDAGAPTYTETSSMPIASASKFWFGAYVVERFSADLSQVDFKAMTMRSGYSNFDNTGCELTFPATVANCYTGGTKNVVNPDLATVDYFFYGGGHFQNYAITLGLGDDTNAQLTAEYQRQLGSELNPAFVTPMPAGGLRMTPADYRKFLQKMLRGELALGKHLGENAVCTLPPGNSGSDCKAKYSPAAPYAWHYSYGHWVEDDASVGDDGSFSSAGMFGFYPWIDATKAFYGILARRSNATRAGMESVQCGRLIRKAFLSEKSAMTG